METVLWLYDTLKNYSTPHLFNYKSKSTKLETKRVPEKEKTQSYIVI